MGMTPGASLDAAISGISRGVDNARKVASEINKDNSSAASATPSKSNPTGKTSTSHIGGNLDVKA